MKQGSPLCDSILWAGKMISLYKHWYVCHHIIQFHRRLINHSSTSPLHFRSSSHYFSTANPTVIDTDKNAACSDDPFKIHPAFHCLSAIKSKSQLLKSYSVTPPIQPWPQYLSPKRLINLISTQHDLELALDIFHHAGKYHLGFSHNYSTYYFIIRKLCKVRAFDHVETLLAELKDSGIYCSENIFIIVIRNYGVWSKPKEALRLFIRMNGFRGVQRSTKSFNTLLNALVQNKQYNLVHGLFKICYEKFHIVPNVITCNILIKALCNKNDIDGSLRILEEMPEIGIIPNLVSYTTVLGGYVVRGDLEGAKKVFDEIRDRGWLPDVMTYTILIDGFCRRGLLVDAIKLMDDMAEAGVEPNEVTYSVMIEAFCREKKSGEATNLINDMLEKRYVPSVALCCRLIDVLCQEGKVENACVLWEKLRIKNVSPDNAILNTLIYWLCKKDKIREARKLFNEFERGLIPSELTYNMLITAMCEKGELSEAGRLWDDMVAKGFAPSAITYSMLIKECCRVGNSKEGIRVLEEMLDRGCTPDRSTYSMLIKCLRDSGSEAEIAQVLSMVSVSGKGPEAKT